MNNIQMQVAMIYKLEVKQDGKANLYNSMNELVREDIPAYEVEAFVKGK